MLAVIGMCCLAFPFDISFFSVLVDIVDGVVVLIILICFAMSDLLMIKFKPVTF